jgi:hypothetical protein
MTIKDKILKFHSYGLVRLVLILILALPAGILWISSIDYSGRLKIENVNSKKRKPFVGYHFLKFYGQHVNTFKNKLSYHIRTLEFGRNIALHFKLQRSGFLNIKDKLTCFIHSVIKSIDKDVEKLIVLKNELSFF